MVLKFIIFRYFILILLFKFKFLSYLIIIAPGILFLKFIILTAFINSFINFINRIILTIVYVLNHTYVAVTFLIAFLGAFLSTFLSEDFISTWLIHKKIFDLFVIVINLL